MMAPVTIIHHLHSYSFSYVDKIKVPSQLEVIMQSPAFPLRRKVLCGLRHGPHSQTVPPRACAEDTHAPTTVHRVSGKVCLYIMTH